MEHQECTCNAFDRNGVSALHHAAAKGADDVVRCVRAWVFQAERRATRKRLQRAKNVAEGFRARCSEHPAQDLALPH